MAIFYLVRHGEADYSEMMEKGFFGFGRDFAPLSKTGVEQAEKTAGPEAESSSNESESASKDAGKGRS